MTTVKPDISHSVKQESWRVKAISDICDEIASTSKLEIMSNIKACVTNTRLSKRDKKIRMAAVTPEVVVTCVQK